MAKSQYSHFALHSIEWIVFVLGFVCLGNSGVVGSGRHRLATLLQRTPAIPVGSTWSERNGVMPSTANCSILFKTQPMDHFSYSDSSKTFRQRYYVYDKWWDQGKNSPIFFYTGNEADVGLYVNATGLMWENGEAFGALLVFAEHRFYGASIPAQSPSSDKALSYLTHELALADFATLISQLRQDYDAKDSAVISFGGSYGGKLSAWLRMKYPSAVAGAISASAPLLAFPGQHPSWESQSYYRVVTKTALSYSDECAENVKNFFPLIDQAAATAEGRELIATKMMLCQTPTQDKMEMLKYFVRDAFDSLAMGNYPWPSSYIAGNAKHLMPPWPAGEACMSLIIQPASVSEHVEMIRTAVSVLYNVTQDVKCYDLPDYPTPQTPSTPMDGIWDWQWCTEFLPDSFWFSTDGVRDMFWDNEYNATLINEHCRLAWGLQPRSGWIPTEYGGRSIGAGHSNIVFSSGGYDGWSSGGIATNLSTSLHAIYIEEGGHHLDLMFSHPNDPVSVINARNFELNSIKTWIEAFKTTRVEAKSWGDLSP
eukprot:m.65186 g.65186  ORF g.65186 m.65186 type:complete len:539 (+) comp23530_c0_seq1:56-1672(+)